MSASNRRIGDLIADIEEQKLVVRPYFQRRLVWTNSNKEKFIETVLRGYPFPEIFVATGALDLSTIKRKNWLVDGQQRITTLLEYARGSDGIMHKTVPRFDSLSPEQKTAFLDYEVAVRDLGTVGEEKIKEIFQRINSTDYALKTMEKLNAMYSGAYNQYCEALARDPFFEKHQVFSDGNRRRMYDTTFCVILVTTILAGYYRRDEKNREYLDRYNDEFPDSSLLSEGLQTVFFFVEECAFPEDSRVWKQTDLFTLLVELYSILVTRRIDLVPAQVSVAVGDFLSKVSHLYGRRSSTATDPLTASDQVFRYLKAATKATNDKYARVERAEILSSIVLSTIDGSERGAN